MVNCIDRYKCKIIREVLPGAVQTPFVEIGFEDDTGTTIITVGNNSSFSNFIDPSDQNHAVIKSFEYGKSNGTGMVVEILDEDGGDFALFMVRLNKSLCNVGKDYRLRCKFGWIIETCNGDTTLEDSGDLFFLPREIKAVYEGGKIKFTVEGGDMMDNIAEERLNDSKGADDTPVALKEAIKKLFAENHPKVPSVRFIRKENNTEREWEWRPSEGGKNGPKGVWNSSQQNSLTTARNWLNPYTTERGEGVAFNWNSESRIPELQIHSVPESGPDGGKIKDACEFSIGTYIVNGGDCSPVISFNPNVKWTFVPNSASGGKTGGNKSGKTKVKVPREGCDTGGVQYHPGVSDTQLANRAPGETLERTTEANTAHELANQALENRLPIEAELKIQGQPLFVNPVLLTGAWISIIVVNPFHIKKNVLGDTACGDWLAQPVCNRVFSNKMWMVKEVHHQIKEGSYTTSIKVFLQAVCNRAGEILPGNNESGDQAKFAFTNANPQNCFD